MNRFTHLRSRSSQPPEHGHTACSSGSLSGGLESCCRLDVKGCTTPLCSGDPHGSQEQSRIERDSGFPCPDGLRKLSQIAKCRFVVDFRGASLTTPLSTPLPIALPSHATPIPADVDVVAHLFGDAHAAQVPMMHSLCHASASSRLPAMAKLSSLICYVCRWRGAQPRAR